MHTTAASAAMQEAFGRTLSRSCVSKPPASCCIPLVAKAGQRQLLRSHFCMQQLHLACEPGHLLRLLRPCIGNISLGLEHLGWNVRNNYDCLTTHHCVMSGELAPGISSQNEQHLLSFTSKQGCHTDFIKGRQGDEVPEPGG